MCWRLPECSSSSFPFIFIEITAVDGGRPAPGFFTRVFVFSGAYYQRPYQVRCTWIHSKLPNLLREVIALKLLSTRHAHSPHRPHIHPLPHVQIVHTPQQRLKTNKYDVIFILTPYNTCREREPFKIYSSFKSQYLMHGDGVKRHIQIFPALGAFRLPSNFQRFLLSRLMFVGYLEVINIM